MGYSISPSLMVIGVLQRTFGCMRVLSSISDDFGQKICKGLLDWVKNSMEHSSIFLLVKAGVCHYQLLFSLIRFFLFPFSRIIYLAAIENYHCFDKDVFKTGLLRVSTQKGSPKFRLHQWKRTQCFRNQRLHEKTSQWHSFWLKHIVLSQYPKTTSKPPCKSYDVCFLYLLPSSKFCTEKLDFCRQYMASAVFTKAYILTILLFWPLLSFWSFSLEDWNFNQEDIVWSALIKTPTRYRMQLDNTGLYVCLL